MIQKTLQVMVLALAVSASATVASAQSASDRAGDLKLWREKCSHPDVDLRTGHIEAAIATDDAIVQRICIRKALDSSSADIRNLGLRAAIASSSQVTFDVEYPKWLAEAYEKAGTDKRKLREVNKSYQARDTPYVENGLTFEVTEARVAGSSSVWFPLASLTEPNDGYKGNAVIRGSRLRWNGSVLFGNSRVTCDLSANLEAGGKLVGVLQCGNRGKYNVSAQLL